ncbi:hypothetical protein LIER_43356 [Lithospermum erythrorhizon]|uniref:Uncharacterized protein n=1 Tax=Lithospermum erythrorhizon TaxID=34254 RepID=A0AAV3PZ02_LITER
MSLADVADLWGKLQGFFQKAREMIVASIVVSPADASEILHNLSLLRVSLEDQASRKQCEVQKTKELKQEIAKLEARTRDMRVQVQE